MSETCVEDRGTVTYFVHGSGLIPVPYHRVNDIREMKSEFHASEVRRGMMMAFAWKPA